MIATPIRWVVMLAIAACGFFMITGNSMPVRAMAFLGSALCWQLHEILTVYDGYVLIKMKSKDAITRQIEIDKLPIEEICDTMKRRYGLSDEDLEGLKTLDRIAKRGVIHDESNKRNKSNTSTRADSIETSVPQIA